jgi:hypothetical protein
MAENALVATTHPQVLTDAKILAGRKLLAELDKAQLKVRAALWLLDAESRQWRLLIATPLVPTHGPRAVYLRIRKALATLNEKEITLQDIGAVPTDHPLLPLLAKVIKTGKGISSIRFAGNTINGTFIEDALIYRLT